MYTLLGRYTTQAGTPPGQLHPPGRYPSGRYPAGRNTTWAGTPQAGTPPGRYTPLGRYPNKRAVRIPLECILVHFVFKIFCSMRILEHFKFLLRLHFISNLLEPRYQLIRTYQFDPLFHKLCGVIESHFLLRSRLYLKITHTVQSFYTNLLIKPIASLVMWRH